MDFEKVAEIVDGVPHMRRPQGRKLFRHIIDSGARDVLELGCSHGVSACYLAAAVDEVGGGRVVTIDRRSGLDLQPNIHDLAKRTGLADLIEPVFAARSYTWELRRFIDRGDRFDFVFVDAGHTWDVTGFGFFLADRLLNSGGWMLFDDLTWTVAGSKSLRDAAWARDLPDEERQAAQVNEVFRVLVEGSGRYDCRVDDRWGWAQKLN